MAGRVLNPGPLALESDTLLTALCGPAVVGKVGMSSVGAMEIRGQLYMGHLV